MIQKTTIFKTLIIIYLTELAIKQYDSEIEEIYKNSGHNIKFE